MSRLGTLAAGILLGARADATVPERYGTGLASIGQAGVGVATTDDGHAALLNPAGLSRLRQATADVGFSLATESFAPFPDVWWDTNRDGLLDERDPPLELSSDVEDAYGVHFSLGRHIGGKFGVGLVGYVPTRRVLQLATYEPDLPTWFLYGSRVQRYAFAAGLGGEVLDGVHVGASIDFVPRVRADFAMTLSGTIVVEGDDDALETRVVADVHDLQLEIIAGFAPSVGLQLDFGRFAPGLDGLWFGAAWRGAVGLPVETRIDAQVDVEVADVGDLDPYLLAIVARAGVSVFDHYVPQTVTAGVAWRKPGRPSVAIDLRYTDWSPMIPSVSHVTDAEIISPLVRVDDEIVDGNPIDVTFRPTLTVRGGVEVPLPEVDLGGRWDTLQVKLRGGGAFEPTPLREQTDESALVDADRGIVALGAGIQTGDPLGLVEGPIWLDVGAQLHAMAPGRLERASDAPRAGFPVTDDHVAIGGRIWVVGAQWGFRY
jgi:hypothetical protein